MPKQYLILDKDSGQIDAVAGLPLAPYTEKTRDIKVFGGMIDIHHVKDAGALKLRAAIEMLNARRENKDLFADVATAVHQLQMMFDKNGTGFVSVGGSPKLIKWVLKKRGFNVVTVNVSGVDEKSPRTRDFEVYLERKLKKLGAPGKIVVMDFVDSGVSLYRLKRDVMELRKASKVYTVAVGTSPKLNKAENERYKKDLDHIVIGIPTLAKALEGQDLKIHILGRHKAKNPYGKWSNEQSKVLETTKYEGMKLLPHEHFERQKTILPDAMERGGIALDVDDFLDVEESSEPEAEEPADEPASD